MSRFDMVLGWICIVLIFLMVLFCSGSFIYNLFELSNSVEVNDNSSVVVSEVASSSDSINEDIALESEDSFKLLPVDLVSDSFVIERWVTSTDSAVTSIEYVFNIKTETGIQLYHSDSNKTTIFQIDGNEPYTVIKNDKVELYVTPNVEFKTVALGD